MEFHLPLSLKYLLLVCGNALIIFLKIRQVIVCKHQHFCGQPTPGIPECPFSLVNPIIDRRLDLDHNAYALFWIILSVSWFFTAHFFLLILGTDCICFPNLLEMLYHIHLPLKNIMVK